MKITEILELAEKGKGIKPEDYKKRAGILAVGHRQEIAETEELLKDSDLTSSQREGLESLLARMHASDEMYGILGKISVGGPELSESESELLGLINTSGKKND